MIRVDIVNNKLKKTTHSAKFENSDKAQTWINFVLSQPSKPWGEEFEYGIEIKDLTQELETAETERKNKKKAIKDAMEAVTDVDTKKVLKYLLRNIDNEE